MIDLRRSYRECWIASPKSDEKEAAWRSGAPDRGEPQE
jgi:hypothetical protein